MVVVEGDEHASPKSAIERDRLTAGGQADDPKVRLACQTRLSGLVVASRKGVRPLA
jgi:ferredoxin